ncbi:hypothetical protein Lal_00023146 [Lupinus albus]|uniref:Putative transcription factor MYB family n=1 Tax=Lupinus albus TaxID=3870 RepID=A0A6A5NCB7_LUPAL|nr:putative transcription factor MYB family [Lupinus albus]KAF1881113.1 hypothetical protein Lal_00023146 [Lupinus albus]
MEDHHHQESQYSINDLRQLIVNGPTSTTHFPSIPPPPTAELFPGHPNLTTATTHHQHYEMMMFGRQVEDIMPRCSLHHHDFTSTNSAAAATTTPTTITGGLEAETAGFIGGDASTGRWPRQETLTLLEIRSSLDPKFKEANQKGPLWDEVSRIMSEEHGYQRSGKKCREKFENLYKYYKKTKEGKAGRQDGKHYRFFRQLEALYGENINQTSVPESNFCTSSVPFHTSSHVPSQTNQEIIYQSHHKHCDSLSLTNSTDFDTSSSDDNDHSIEGLKDNGSMQKRPKRVSGRSWKVKIKEFIDSQMRKLVEKQEEWMDKLMKTMEQKEKERLLREEEWRKQEVERLEREHKFWAKERTWIEARDIALMQALQKLTGNEIEPQTQLSLEGINAIATGVQNQNEDGGSEILNSTTGVRGSESIISNKKRKENSSCFYFDDINDHRSNSLYTKGSDAYCDINDQRQEISERRLHTNDGSSPSNSNVGNAVPTADSCFPFLMNEGGNLWQNYSLKVNKGNQNQNQ